VPVEDDAQVSGGFGHPRMLKVRPRRSNGWC